MALANDGDRFAEIMARLRAGDEDAAAEVFHRFASRLIRLARMQLCAKIRHKEDAEDVVQSVYKSFFVRQRSGQFQLGSWESLWGALTVITLRKCCNRVEYFWASRRDVRRERRMPQKSVDWESVWQVVARDPSPSQAAMLTEATEHLMRGLDPDDQQILVLHLQGYTVAEICERVDYAERTIYRALDRIRKRLSRMQAETHGIA